MNWYLAKIVYRIVCGEGNHTPQFDEQLRLILAVDTVAAHQKAKAIGEMEQHSFENESKSLVKWQFINVAELYRMHPELDGAEVYSRIVETHNPHFYINDIHDRSAQLLQADPFYVDPSV